MSKIVFLCVLVCAGCAGLPTGAEARSLDGRLLYAPPLSAEERAEREGKLAEARALYLEDPQDLNAIVWYGRRLAYLARYHEAIAVYTEGLRHHPRSAELYRHRGHRYITIRRFDSAVSDLERAAGLVHGHPDRVEQDGLPNARDQPTSTLHFNIHYHLGLAYYLRGQFEKAEESYRDCLIVSRNPDALVATSHWLHTTLRRLGLDEDARQVLAPIRQDLDVIENHAYHRLCLLYRGELEPEQVVGGTDSSGSAANYGVARWHMAEGRRQRGLELLYQLVRLQQWAAFGVIAAEADLYRSGLLDDAFR